MTGNERTRVAAKWRPGTRHLGVLERIAATWKILPDSSQLLVVKSFVYIGTEMAYQMLYQSADEVAQ